MKPSPAVGDADYERLLAFRDGLRRFLRWSEGEAKRAGLTPARRDDPAVPAEGPQFAGLNA